MDALPSRSRRARLLTSGLVLLGLLAAPAAGAAADSVFAIENASGGHTLWTVAAPGAAASGLDVEAFLPIRLVGYPRLVSLRRDRPSPVYGGSAPHLRLPQGGSLYRVETLNGTALVQVLASGPPRLLLEVPDAGATRGIAPEVHVSPEGTRAIVASPLPAGGDVFVLDLVGGAPSHCVTAGSAPVAVAPESLRVSTMAAWFVVDSKLLTAVPPLVGQMQPTALELAGVERVHPELAMADGGGSVVALIQGKPGESRLASVAWSGWVLQVTSEPKQIDPPGFDDLFGPSLAVSSDGLLVAFRERQVAPTLFAKRLDLPGSPTQITSPDPNPGNGIDNIGVLGMAGVGAVSFLGPRTLAFVAGDLAAVALGEDEVENAELFAADLSVPGATAYTNLTQTSGQSSPPFDQPGALEVAAAFVGPDAQRILFYGETPAGDDELVSVRFDLGGGAQSFTSLAGDFEDAPVLTAAGGSVLVIGQHDSDSAPWSVELLPPLQEGVPDALQTLATLGPDAEPDRIAAHRDGPHAAFVVRSPSGMERPWLVDTAARVARPLLTVQGATVSEALAFDGAGRLVFGLDGASTGNQRFLAFDPAGVPTGLGGRFQLLPLAPGRGFPLEP